VTVHDGCPLGPEAESFTKRLRELEAQLAAHLADYKRLTIDHEKGLQAIYRLEEELMKLRLQQAKWLGAIAVVVAVCSFAATVVARIVVK
jgi:hypothetical protein